MDDLKKIAFVFPQTLLFTSIFARNCAQSQELRLRLGKGGEMVLCKVIVFTLCSSAPEIVFQQNAWNELGFGTAVRLTWVLASHGLLTAATHPSCA